MLIVDVVVVVVVDVIITIIIIITAMSSPSSRLNFATNSMSSLSSHSIYMHQSFSKLLINGVLRSTQPTTLRGTGNE